MASSKSATAATPPQATPLEGWLQNVPDEFRHVILGIGALVHDLTLVTRSVADAPAFLGCSC